MAAKKKELLNRGGLMETESEEILYQYTDEEEDKHYPKEQPLVANIDREFESRDFDSDLGADITDLDNSTYFETSRNLKLDKKKEW